jgi:hypothetical protein
MPAEPDAERRQGERVEILGDLHGEMTVLQDMVVREIGPEGAQIETRTPLRLDSLHTLRLPLGSRPIVVRGRVVHCRVSEIEQDAVAYCAGIEFVEMPPAVREAIEEFLRFLRAARAGAH